MLSIDQVFYYLVYVIFLWGVWNLSYLVSLSLSLNLVILDRNSNKHNLSMVIAMFCQVEDQENVVEFWKNSLNPLTWTEILCQVLIAAGFGSKQGGFRKEVLSKVLFNQVAIFF